MTLLRQIEVAVANRKTTPQDPLVLIQANSDPDTSGKSERPN
ncbi:MAG: hypothetical protein WA020_16745 [Candidatus Acidiferrales bacterium]